MSPCLEAEFDVAAVVEPLRAMGHVEAVCLTGSFARSSSAPDASSDVDFLAIVDDETPSDAVRAIVRTGRQQQLGRPVELRVLRRRQLDQMLATPTVFATHVAREGKVLFDRSGVLGRYQASFPVNQPVQERADRLRDRFSLYETLDWCNGHFLFCLADLYAVARSTAMLGLAQRGQFELDRNRVFISFAEAFPDLSPDTDELARLAPFYMVVQRGRPPSTLPFSPRGDEGARRARRARRACERIFEVVA